MSTPSTVAKGLESCPKCKHRAIFVPLVPAVGYDGKLYGRRSEGFCNSPVCDQLLWYYPSSGLVTRRTKGLTLKEYTDGNWKSVTDLDLINIRRRNGGLPPLIVASPPKSWLLRRRLTVVSWFWAHVRTPAVVWFWWFVAALKYPFIDNTPSPLVDADALNELKSGEGSYNGE